jgi:hypothetical protein
VSGDIHTPTNAGPVPTPPLPGEGAPGAAAPAFDDDVADRPEFFVLGAFAGGLTAAFILKRLTRQ